MSIVAYFFHFAWLVKKIFLHQQSWHIDISFKFFLFIKLTGVSTTVLTPVIQLWANLRKEAKMYVEEDNKKVLSRSKTKN